jgi:sugar transferase (PEP-CTERM/EpsH1 system associated)
MVRRVVHQYVAMSRDLAAYLRNAVGVPDDRINQIYSGVDTDKFHPKKSAEATPWPEGFAPAGSIIIGTVGRLEPVKNPLGLVRAFSRLIELVPRARQRLRLVLVGAGPMQAEVMQAVQQAGIQELVWLAGARDDVPLLMRHLDVFVLPSLNEGISNTILEAMASGIPVVAGNVGGNPEIVMDGVTGRLYEVGDDDLLAEMLRQYVADDELRVNHGMQARTTIESRHSISSMVDTYLRVYDMTLKGQH